MHFILNWRHHLPVICLLGLLIILPYSQVRQHEYLVLDDLDYIVKNPYVNQGFSARGVWRAFDFRNSDQSYYRPLTWISHMLDFQLWGAASGYHHMVNVGLHFSNAILLYAILFAMTGAWGLSILVAGLFAAQPINVESVAWLTERSNLLCTLFGLVSLAAYIHYARKPDLRRYASVVLAFIASLLAKPNLATLPFLMLLLDYWPLSRCRLNRSDISAYSQDSTTVTAASANIGRLVAEKLPLIALSVLAIAASIIRLGGTTSSVQVPWMLRLANIPISYLRYLQNIFWPNELVAFYPYPQDIRLWSSLGGLAVLVAVSVLTLWFIRTKPYLFVGWFWFAGTLFPKSGMIQSGLWPALADRWAYFPAIGLFILIAWAVYDIQQKWTYPRRRATALIAVVWIGTLMGLTWKQVGTWSGNKVFFERMLAFYPENAMGQNNLGIVLLEAGDIEGSEQRFMRALEIDPSFEIAYINLGRIAVERGEYAKALSWYRQALARKPEDPDVHVALGRLFLRQGEFRLAAGHYSRALQVMPDKVEAINGLGAALTKINRLNEAVKLFKEALRIDPEYLPARQNLAAVEAALEDDQSSSTKP